MIFVNEGLVQVTNNPVQMVFDLAMAVRCIYEQIEDDGITRETADDMVELALRLANMTDDEIQNFMLTLPTDRPISFAEMLDRLDLDTADSGVIFMDNGMLS